MGWPNIRRDADFIRVQIWYVCECVLVASLHGHNDQPESRNQKW